MGRTSGELEGRCHLLCKSEYNNLIQISKYIFPPKSNAVKVLPRFSFCRILLGDAIDGGSLSAKLKMKWYH